MRTHTHANLLGQVKLKMRVIIRQDLMVQFTVEIPIQKIALLRCRHHLEIHVCEYEW